MKEFWRKHCTTVIAGIMLLAIVILLYIILTSTTINTNNEAKAEIPNNNSNNSDINTDPNTNQKPPIIINKHPRAATAVMGFSAIQTLLGSGEEELLDSWSFNDNIYLIIKTSSDDLDFGANSPSLAVAVLDKDGTLLKVALYGSNPVYLSGKITGNGLLLLLAEQDKTTLTRFSGENFAVVNTFPKASSASMYLLNSEVIFILASNDGVYFCNENGNKIKLSQNKAKAVDIMCLGNSYYLFFDKMIITLNSVTNDFEISALSKSLQSVLPTVIENEFGFLSVERDNGIFYSAFYKRTALKSGEASNEKILILGAAESVFLTKSVYGYSYTLNMGTVKVLSVDGLLSAPMVYDVSGVETACYMESVGTDSYFIAKENGFLYLVKRSSNTVKTSLLSGTNGKILISDGKIWAIVCGEDISLIKCS